MNLQYFFLLFKVDVALIFNGIECTFRGERSMQIVFSFLLWFKKQKRDGWWDNLWNMWLYIPGKIQRNRFDPREMPINSQGSWSLQGRDKIIPATSVEKASRLQLKELKELNKGRRSSILCTVCILVARKLWRRTAVCGSGHGRTALRIVHRAGGPGSGLLRVCVARFW